MLVVVFVVSYVVRKVPIAYSNEEFCILEDSRSASLLPIDPIFDAPPSALPCSNCNSLSYSAFYASASRALFPSYEVNMLRYEVL